MLPRYHLQAEVSHGFLFSPLSFLLLLPNTVGPALLIIDHGLVATISCEHERLLISCEIHFIGDFPKEAKIDDTSSSAGKAQF